MSYDELDEILYRIDNNLALDALDKNLVEKVKKMMTSSEHKNRMPPKFKVD